jgi:GNAT superfamily N-acetyltransferase
MKTTPSECAPRFQGPAQPGPDRPEAACICYSTDLPTAEQFAVLFGPLGWFPSRSLEEFRRSLAGSWYCICAYDDDHLVGFGRVISDGVIHALLTEVAVAATHRHRGIGRTIMTRLVQRCTNAGIRQIQLFSAEGKIPFYQNVGFEPRPAGRPGMQYSPKTNP